MKETFRQHLENHAKDKNKNPQEVIDKLEKKYGPEKLAAMLDSKEEREKFDDWIQEAASEPSTDSAESSPDYQGNKEKIDRTENVNSEISKLLNVKEVIGDVSDLRELKVDQLIKLEDTYPGILLYAFTNIVDQETPLDFANWNGYKEPTAGQKLEVNFLGSAEAERKIGAGDILPPSVRKITVYEDGNLNKAETSEKRIGLKGRNRADHGFFNQNGYIAIYTGDIVLIGDDINRDFDKFQKDEDYAASESGKKDNEYLQELVKKNPKIRRQKELTEEEILEIMNSIESGTAQERLIQSVKAVIDNKIYPKHCWDWLNTVYKTAGIKKRRRIYQNLNYEGKDCRPSGSHAPESLVAALKPGDWIYYNNRNTADSHGNHSAIFCGWKDESRRIALVASGSHGRIGKYHTADLKDKPVTHITRPVA